MARIAPAHDRPMFVVASYAPGHVLLYWDGTGQWVADAFAAKLHGNRTTAQRVADEWNAGTYDEADVAGVVRVQ